MRSRLATCSSAVAHSRTCTARAAGCTHCVEGERGSELWRVILLSQGGMKLRAHCLMPEQQFQLLVATCRRTAPVTRTPHLPADTRQRMTSKWSAPASRPPTSPG